MATSATCLRTSFQSASAAAALSASPRARLRRRRAQLRRSHRECVGFMSGPSTKSNAPRRRSRRSGRPPASSPQSGTIRSSSSAAAEPELVRDLLVSPRGPWSCSALYLTLLCDAVELHERRVGADGPQRRRARAPRVCAAPRPARRGSAAPAAARSGRRRSARARASATSPSRERPPASQPSNSSQANSSAASGSTASPSNGASTASAARTASTSSSAEPRPIDHQRRKAGGTRRPPLGPDRAGGWSGQPRTRIVDDRPDSRSSVTLAQHAGTREPAQRRRPRRVSG